MPTNFGSNAIIVSTSLSYLSSMPVPILLAVSNKTKDSWSTVMRIPNSRI